MLLNNKVAVIYGGGGSLGSAVAKAFVEARAQVVLAGRHIASLQKAASSIAADSANIQTDVVDALDEAAVNAHLNAVTTAKGHIDISFNAISLQDRQNMPLTEMSVEDFLRPVTIAMRSQFITATAAARLMMPQRSGVILSLTATPGGIGYPFTGGFAPACVAIETLCQNLGAELGKYGIRTVNIRSAGSPDSRVFKEVINTGDPEVTRILNDMTNDTMIKQLPLMADIANVATFLVSDLAAKITGVTVDVTAGTTAALNYKSGVMPFK